MTFRKPSHWVTIAVTCALLASCGGSNSSNTGSASDTSSAASQQASWGPYYDEPTAAYSTAYTIASPASNTANSLSIIDAATGQPFSGLARMHEAQATSVWCVAENGKTVFYAVINQRLVRIDPSEGPNWQAVQISAAANVAVIEQVWSTSSSVNTLFIRTVDDHLLSTTSDRTAALAPSTPPFNELRVLRSWRGAGDAAGSDYTGHLVIDPTGKRLVMLSGDFQSVLRRFDDGPTVDHAAAAAWIAPSLASAGILRVGLNLHRFEWTGEQASLSAPLYTLHTKGLPEGDWYTMAADTKALAVLDGTTVVLLAPDGKVLWQVDLSLVAGMTQPVSVNGLSMGPQAILVAINRGLLAIDRSTGKTTWLDKFDGAHAVKRVLWVSSDSIGYVVGVPSPSHAYEQVIRFAANGYKQVVADHVQVPRAAEIGAEANEHRELGTFSNNPPVMYPWPYYGQSATGTHAIWCVMPAEIVSWTCKGQPFFAFNVNTGAQIALGSLNTSLEWITPPSMIEGHDVITEGHSLMVTGSPPGSGDDNLNMRTETWAFDPSIAESLHLVDVY